MALRLLTFLALPLTFTIAEIFLYRDVASFRKKELRAGPGFFAFLFLLAVVGASFLLTLD